MLLKISADTHQGVKEIHSSQIHHCFTLWARRTHHVRLFCMIFATINACVACICAFLSLVFTLHYLVAALVCFLFLAVYKRRAASRHCLCVHGHGLSASRPRCGLVVLYSMWHSRPSARYQCLYKDIIFFFLSLAMCSRSMTTYISI